MEKNSRRYNRSTARELYIYDSTVRQLQVFEDPELERENKQQRKINREVRRNREYATSMNAGYVIFLIFAVVITFGVCMHYLQLVSSVSDVKENIVTLQRQATKAKSANDEMQRKLDTSVDMEYIRNTAINELGMVYASKDQVVMYDYQESDYVRQYEEIPEADKQFSLAQ